MKLNKISLSIIFQSARVKGELLEKVLEYEKFNEVRILHIFEEKRKFNRIKQNKTTIEIGLSEVWRRRLTDYQSNNIFREFNYVLVKKRRLKNSKVQQEVLLIEFLKTEIDYKKKKFIIHLGEII